jgi:diguanylate cyclase (GGDEF)-like protein
MSVKNAIHHYLNSVSQLTGADAVSLYLEVDSPRQLPLLFHVGNMEPVGELANEERAADFCTAALQLQFADAADAQAFQFYPSRDQGGYLCCLDIQRVQSLLGPAPVQEQRDNRRSSGRADARSNLPEMLWLGLRYGQELPCPVAETYLNKRPPFTGKPPQTSEEWLFWTLGLGGQMAWEAYQQSLLPLDGITYLPGRVEFQAYLGREHDKAFRDGQPLGLLLINPDEFGLINHRLGQEAGDTALRDIAVLLTENLRQSDQVFRYGGAIFSVVMPAATRSAVNTVAEKLRKTLTQATFANSAARFSFSVGAAVCNSSEEGDTQATEASELLRRADQALNVAKLSGGARTVIWNPEGTEAGAGNLDRLSGIFTADTEKDYRNMLLLWETITVISSWSETDVIAQEFVERIGASVKPRQVGLFVNRDGEKGHLLAVSKSQPNHADRTSDKGLLLSDTQKKLIDEAEQQRRTQRLRFGKGDSERGYIAYAIPLLSRQDCFGVLYLDGQEDTLRLDTSDLVFLDALASQIGVLLDRAMLASRWKEEQLRESQRLLQEVKELRQSKRQTRLVYHSSSMKSVMSVLNKAAPTDITVLIGGESGTGKDMLARAVHDMSERKDKSFVTVDCGAIAQSLIDTELFGHMKGAYTGAQSASSGRISQAKGGTLFLDEIGELPLDTQSKLLRLIQEKEITPVGGTSPIKVDVRIIAATNRDLAKEVEQGLFRRDLYYRLQVVTVTAPSLRERPEDILPLANYFLEHFVADYGKAGLAFNQAAEKVLQDYSWPGNVRELQNRVLQAVIMSDRQVIGWEELRLPVTLGLEAEPLAAPDTDLFLPQQKDAFVENTVADYRFLDADAFLSNAAEPQKEVVDSSWMPLRELLRSQILAILEQNSVPVPLGRWLADDLVLTAHEAVGHVARRGSVVLGMPETTFRRRLEKVRRENEAGLLVRNPDWSIVSSVLSDLIEENKRGGGETNLFDEVRSLLLQEVVTHVQQNDALGSALMGITVLTYRRWTDPQQREAV